MTDEEFNYQFEGMKHDVLSKLAIGSELTREEKAFFLLFLATEKETKRFLKNERKKDKH